jgi:hypothetical protein
MSETFSSPSGDLKLPVLVAFAARTTDKAPLKSDVLHAVGLNYWINIRRIKWMILAPSLVGDLTIQIQRCFDKAELEITGELKSAFAFASHPRRDEIARRAQEIFNMNTQEIMGAVGTQEYDQFVLNAIDHGTQPVVLLSGRGAPARSGLEAMLSSVVTGMWTAFETMAGDLWEASLNVHPEGLAELKGKRKRLSKGADAESSFSEARDETEPANLKSVPLNEILRHRFKIEDKMGTVLRTQRRFDHLVGIKEAYAIAFHKKAERIDEPLQHEGIEALNALRNLIVHRSGIVDQTYAKKAAALGIPTAPIGSAIALDGQIVRDLMVNAIVPSYELMVAVDDWIREN